MGLKEEINEAEEKLREVYAERQDVLRKIGESLKERKVLISTDECFILRYIAPGKGIYHFFIQQRARILKLNTVLLDHLIFNVVMPEHTGQQCYDEELNDPPISHSVREYAEISDEGKERALEILEKIDVDNINSSSELNLILNDADVMFNERYSLKRKIGEGGSRRVYLAIDPVSGDETCIKIFKTEKLHRRASDLRDRHPLEEILARETRSLRRLSHPNLVRFYTAGKAGDLLYIEEEYIDGTNLEKIAPKLSYTEKVEVFTKIMAGVNYLHQNGFIVRDLKLDNTLISHDRSEVKIDDLEFISKTSDISQAFSEYFLQKKTYGSYRYAAPELRKGESATQASDIFALGCMFYYLLTGERDTFEKLTILPEKEYETKLNKLVNSDLFPIYSETRHHEDSLKRMLDYRPSLRLNAPSHLVWFKNNSK